MRKPQPNRSVLLREDELFRLTRSDGKGQQDLLPWGRLCGGTVGGSGWCRAVGQDHDIAEKQLGAQGLCRVDARRRPFE